jgi:hypothetical protein
MAWLWTDTLAALLVEHDRVSPESVAAWFRHPSAYRLPEGTDPLSLARRLLVEVPTQDRDDRGPPGGVPPPPIR